MAKLHTRTTLTKDIRGAIAHTNNGWSVTMPMGIKNRRMVEFVFRADFRLSFSRSNSKLQKTAKKYSEKTGKKIELWAFNLPALLACPGASECPLFCYALQGQFGFRNVMETRARNFATLHELNRQGGWTRVAQELIAGLHKIVADSPKNCDEIWVRIHDSGDMFSLWYLRAWAFALSQVPEVKGYAYTKSIGLLSRVELPSNLRIVQSIGGTMDSQMDVERSHSRVFASHADRVAAGYDDGAETDIPAMTGTVRIGLVYHGSEKLETIAA